MKWPEWKSRKILWGIYEKIEPKPFGDYKDTLTDISKTWDVRSTFSRIVDDIGSLGFGDFKQGDIFSVLDVEEKRLLLFSTPQCFLYLLNQVFSAIWHCAVFHNMAIAWARYQINMLPVSVATELLVYAESYFCPKIKDGDGRYHSLVKDRDFFTKEQVLIPQSNGDFVVIEATEENGRFLSILSSLISRFIDYKAVFADKKRALLEQYKENLAKYSPSEDERFLGFQNFQMAVEYYFGSIPKIEGFPLRFNESGSLDSGYSDIRLPKSDSSSATFDSRDFDKKEAGKFALETKQEGQTWERVADLIKERFGVEAGRDTASNWAKAYWESVHPDKPMPRFKRGRPPEKNK